MYGDVPPDGVGVNETTRGALPLAGFAVTATEKSVVTTMEAVAVALWLAPSCAVQVAVY